MTPPQPDTEELIERVSLVALLVYAGLLALTCWEFQRLPTGFVPQQDAGYLLLNVQLPEADVAAGGAVAGEVVGPPERRRLPVRGRLLTAVQARRLQGRPVPDYLYEALLAHRAGLPAPRRVRMLAAAI